MAFKKATKQQAKGRFAFFGPAGSGKSYTSLRIACAIAKASGGRVAAIDTERGSLSKYADVFDFDAMELDNFAPQNYIAAIEDAAKAGYSVLVIDSLSHAWMGKGGTLEQVDQAAKRQRGNGNSFTAWKDVTPIQNQMVDAILGAPMHIIVTMRVKTEYVIEEVNGKKVPRKLGMQPVQRDGMEYEFDVVGDLDADCNLVVTKTRCPALTGKVFNKPGEDVAGILMAWLTDGTPATTPAAPVAPQPFATPEQIAEAVELLKVVHVESDIPGKWFAKAGAKGWSDMPPAAIQGCIGWLKERRSKAADQAMKAEQNAAAEKAAQQSEQTDEELFGTMTGAEFKTKLRDMAAVHNVTRQKFENGIKQFLARDGAAGASLDDLSPAGRVEVAEAIGGNAFNYETGEITRELAGAK